MTESKTDHQGSKDNPLNEFSGCHVGIIKNFNRLEQLLTLVEKSPDAPEIKKIAEDLLDFFQLVVLKHHLEEEQELFAAVLDSAKNEHAKLAKDYIQRLVAEHRELEAMWKQIEPAIKKLAKGKATELDSNITHKLTQKYLAHAEFEEQEFLPLSAKILSENDLSALGLSLHMRHLETSKNYYI